MPRLCVIHRWPEYGAGVRVAVAQAHPSIANGNMKLREGLGLYFALIITTDAIYLSPSRDQSRVIQVQLPLEVLFKYCTEG